MSVPGSFVARQLRVTFTLAQAGNVFPGTSGTSLVEIGSNTLVLNGLRTVAVLTGSVRFLPLMDLEVYGMLQQDMNALSVIRWGPLGSFQNNFVTLEAYSGNSWSLIFSGSIIEASPEYRALPDVYFHVQAAQGYGAGVSPGTALSYPNGVGVAGVLAIVAKSMGLTLQNNGVTATLGGARYWAGSPKDQLDNICNDSGTDYYIDADGVLAICPQGQPRVNSGSINLSPTTGLIGYPGIDSAGIHIDALFNPAMILATTIVVSGSEVPAANGVWVPRAVVHQLESVRPGGMWQSSIDCQYIP